MSEKIEGLVEMLKKLSKEIKDNPRKIERDFKYPLEISGIIKSNGTPKGMHSIGSLVKIRPCAKQYENKTFLGIYLGDLPIEPLVCLKEKTNELEIILHRNPAIFIPEIKRIIYGCESWWSEVKNEDELSDITNDDIDKTWYVKLLKAMNKD